MPKLYSVLQPFFAPAFREYVEPVDANSLALTPEPSFKLSCGLIVPDLRLLEPEAPNTS